MTELAARVRELARVVAASRVAVLQVVCQRRSMSLLAFDSAGRQVTAGGGGELFEALCGVQDLLRTEGEDRPLVIELRRRRFGGRQFRHTFDLVSVSPAQLVLDSGYRHPRHPRRGMPLPLGIAVEDRPTDPAVLATVRGLVDEYKARYAAVKGRLPNFGTGYSEAEILAAETAMGLRLPEDVRALYRTVHDDMAEHGLLGTQSLLPLETVVAEYLDGVPGSYGWDDDVFAVNPVVFDTCPNGLVRRVSRCDWWVTIATNHSGDWCAVDLDPALHGTTGQLIEYGRNVIGPVGYIAGSVTAVLRQVVVAVRDGAYHDDGDPESPHLATVGRIGAAGPAPYSQVCQVGGRSVAAVVADLEAPLDVQQLYLNDGGGIDLADLGPLRNLRAVSVNRAATVRLALLHNVPTEALSVEAIAVDPAPLARHPTLWHLTLKGLSTPVAIEPLTTLPALAHLDLSAVEVTDLERVTTLPALRVLALNQRQWQHLRDHDAVPTALAAAELGEQTSLADAIDWATWLRTRSGG